MKNKIFSVSSILLLSFLLFAGEKKDTMIQFEKENFHSIHNSTSADLQMKIGEDWKVEAYGDEKSLRQLNVEKINGKLIIKRKVSFFFRRPLGPIQFYISMPLGDLKSLSMSSSGNAEVIGRLDSSYTELKASSSGSINAAGSVKSLTIISSSSGNISFSGNCNTIDLKLSSSGDADIKIKTNTLNASLSSSGNVFIEGSAERTGLRISSSGKFNGDKFTTETLDIKVSSSGDAEMNVIREINAILSSSGSLFYRGEARITRSRMSSSGEIKKMD